jgi:hypothetical protein
LHHFRYGGSELLEPDGVCHIAQVLVEHAAQILTRRLDSMNGLTREVDAQ